MKKLLFSLIALSSLFFSATAQTPYTDAKSGYTLNVPDGWNYQGYESGELSFRASDTSGTAFFDVNLKKLQPGVTAKQHVEYLESYMVKAGYSQNFMPEDSRDIKGDAAKPYNATEVYGGAYTIEKNGVVMVQMIFVYRQGVYAYLTVQTCPRDSISDLQDQYAVFYNSFKLL